jgi:hypothetical protein
MRRHANAERHPNGKRPRAGFPARDCKLALISRRPPASGIEYSPSGKASPAAGTAAARRQRANRPAWKRAIVCCRYRMFRNDPENRRWAPESHGLASGRPRGPSPDSAAILEHRFSWIPIWVSTVEAWMPAAAEAAPVADLNRRRPAAEIRTAASACQANRRSRQAKLPADRAKARSTLARREAWRRSSEGRHRAFAVPEVDP